MVNENLQRCLTIEPPEPALKLETLSEIAQVSVLLLCVRGCSLQRLGHSPCVCAHSMRSMSSGAAELVHL
jgi:hypothetical protein